MATDFSQGKVWHNIVSQAIPLILAQLVQILYNVVDRIYIGHLPGEKKQERPFFSHYSVKPSLW